MLLFFIPKKSGQLIKLLDDLAEFLGKKAKGKSFNDEIKKVLDDAVEYIKKNANDFKKINNVIDEVELARFIKANRIKGNIDIPYVLRISNNRKDLAESLLLSLKEVREGKTVSQLMRIFKITDLPLPESLSNYQTRIWYTWKKMQLERQIKSIKNLEDKAKKAFELRNEYRTSARQYMQDRKWAEHLENVEKNQEWEKLLERTF